MWSVRVPVTEMPACHMALLVSSWDELRPPRRSAQMGRATRAVHWQCTDVVLRSQTVASHKVLFANFIIQAEIPESLIMSSWMLKVTVMLMRRCSLYNLMSSTQIILGNRLHKTLQLRFELPRHHQGWMKSEKVLSTAPPTAVSEPHIHTLLTCPFSRGPENRKCSKSIMNSGFLLRVTSGCKSLYAHTEATVRRSHSPKSTTYVTKWLKLMCIC